MMSEVSSAEGKRVEALRESKGMKQYELEKLAKLSAGYVARLEKHGKPKRLPDDKVRAIAKALGVEESEITGVKSVDAAERTVEYDDPYPSRQQAIALLEDDPRISKGTLKALRLAVRADGSDPGVEEWLKLAAKLEKAKLEAALERDKMFDVRPGRGK